jgi:hypothetical protein
MNAPDDRQKGEGAVSEVASPGNQSPKDVGAPMISPVLQPRDPNR